MSLLSPSPLTFWRFFFLLGAMLCLRSVAQIVERGRALGVDFAASRAWMGLILAFALLGLSSLLLLALTWSPYRDRLLSLTDLPGRRPDSTRWIGGLLSIVALIGFSSVFMVPFVLRNISGLNAVRHLVFLSFTLLGMAGIRLLRPQTSWFGAFVAAALCQTTFHLLLLYWGRVTTYPFAMGWSETSRFYYPSLFFSERVYGREYPWPILHPTLHLLLAPPYLFDAPLWVHRFWQVALRYILVAAVVPPLLSRLSISGRAGRWLVGLWMFLYLFMGPVYFHLTVPVILVLLGFSAQNERRTWLVVLAASVWCGWSRVNWYPMPGMIAAILYLMEVPYEGKGLMRYLLKPALWFALGTLTAFLSQRVYIALSGIPDSGVFYTSFTSDLLWYRLWPNASFSMGILPGAIWVSLPMWLAMYLVLRARRRDWHPIRWGLIVAALLVVFVGGVIVSLKIGGGANLHNMDAYFILLLIVVTYLICARYGTEDGRPAQPRPLHWLLVLWLLYSPVTTFLQFGLSFPRYDVIASQQVLAHLQKSVEDVHTKGGEVLFITQRHLISMDMLTNVTLVAEYEREDLMEIAMANNEEYLAAFEADMDEQRFDLIVVDPLNYRVLSRRRGFSEENNVWVTRIMKHILCNYREEIQFPSEEIALYVPQEEPRQCP